MAQCARLVAVLPLLLTASGCGSGTATSAQPSTGTPTTAPSAPTAPASPTTAAVPFPSDTSPDGGPADPGGVPADSA